MTPPLPTPSPGSAGGDAVVRLGRIGAALQEIAGHVPAIGSDDLAAVAAAATAVVAAAEAARAAVVLEASERGAILASDHPRVDHWVEQSAREGGAPVARSQARHLKDIAALGHTCDLDPLREAIVTGRIPLESAAHVARVYRRFRRDTEHGNWEAILRILIDWAADGAHPSELAQLEDMIIGQYGTAAALDRAHEREHERRELTTFRRDAATGMLTATVRLDAASEAVFSAAIHALSAPRVDEDGTLDERTPGQRRADALLTLAGLACTPRTDLPGSGSKARVVVTMTLETLMSGLDDRTRMTEAGPWGATEQGCATTGFGQVLSPTEARILACDAHIVPAVLGADGEILDLGRAKRLVTPGLNHALQLRDKGCSYPGCSAPPSWCDGHHIVHWAKGGRTDLGNLALLCRHHHTVVHRHGHTATVTATGVHWTRHDGSPLGTRPRSSRPA